MNPAIYGLILLSISLIGTNYCCGAYSHNHEAGGGSSSGSGVVWRDGSQGSIPAEAVVVGYDAGGKNLFLARANHDGGAILGKIRPGFGGAHIPYGDKELAVNPYQVFCGARKFKWVSASGGAIPSYAIRMGSENDPAYNPNSPRMLYAARAMYKGDLTPGKIAKGFGGAHIPWGGQEIVVTNYEVLCYD